MVFKEKKTKVQVEILVLCSKAKLLPKKKNEEETGCVTREKRGILTENESAFPVL